MADMKVNSTAPAQEVAKTEAPQKADNAVMKHLKSLKNAILGPVGGATIAGAASAALLGAALPYVAVGAVVGLGIGAGIKALNEDKKGLGFLNVGAAGALAGAAFGLPGLLVGATAVAFGTGEAQKAAGKIAKFVGSGISKILPDSKPEPAPAQ